MQKDELLKLAERVDACAEHAKRVIVYQGYGYSEVDRSAATVSLANGLEAVAKALRALAGG